MEATSLAVVKLLGVALLALVLEGIGELVYGLFIERPATNGLRRLARQTWAQRLYRSRTGAWLAPVWLLAGFAAAQALRALNTFPPKWIGALAVITFIGMPVLALLLTMWWLHSPTRPRGHVAGGAA
jgi:hypothetical protein